jgi:hypothetical protein
MRKGRIPYLSRTAVVVALAFLACRSKEPRLSVFYPAPSSHFVQGDTIHFASELNSELDPGPIKPNAWRWVSNIDGEIGRGPRADVTSLRIGKHVITATVEHRLGISRDSVTVFVDPPKITR